MTIFEAINKIDTVKPNNYSDEEKVGWLSSLDLMIKSKIIDTHEGADTEAFGGYTDDTDLSTNLLAPAPYDDMYIFWLESKIDYWNGETGKYNNSISMFNNAYAEYERFYNRTHMPLSKKLKFFPDETDSIVWQSANEVAMVTIEEV